MDISDVTIVECETGIYTNNSRVEIRDTKIEGAFLFGGGGNAIDLVNSTSGQVIIDSCDIHDNGYNTTYASGAIYMNNSDPRRSSTPRSTMAAAPA